MVMSSKFRNQIQDFVKGWFEWVGVRIEYDHPFRNPVRLLALKSAERGVNTVFDVGANRGQFAQALRAVGYRNKIVSFEPLSEPHDMLGRLSETDQLWEIAPRLALGNRSDEVTMNVAVNLASSSLLSVNQRSIEVTRGAAFSGTEVVSVRRLDDTRQNEWKGPYALKIDTQGFELEVLKGAPVTLALSEVVMVEMSLANLYEGGASFAGLYSFLESNGFRCISLCEGFVDLSRNEVLQVDGVFVRNR